MWANTLVMEIVSSNGTLQTHTATEVCDGESLQCRWVYGHPHAWTLNGKPISKTEAADWLHRTYHRREQIWGMTCACA